MKIAYRDIALGSLLRMLAAIGLATAFLGGLLLSALEFAGISYLSDAARDDIGLLFVPVLFVVSLILVDAVTLAFAAGALLLRALGRGPRLVVREDRGALARRFD
jgi:hypothetical protein